MGGVHVCISVHHRLGVQKGLQIRKALRFVFLNPHTNLRPSPPVWVHAQYPHDERLTACRRFAWGDGPSPRMLTGRISFDGSLPSTGVLG